VYIMDHYRLIGSDNYYERQHLAITAMLKKLEVNAFIFQGEDYVVFKIPSVETSKLPTDKDGFYLPLYEDAGFTLFTEREFKSVFKRLVSEDAADWVAI
jgi:hypothetical protein